MASSTAAPIIPNATISSTDRIARAHQAPFCARGLLKIGAVSENAPGAHRNVPRAGGCSTDGPAGRGVGDSTCKGVARSFPSASVMTEGPAGPSTQCAHDRPSLPDPVGHASPSQNAAEGVSSTEPDGIRSGSPGPEVTGAWFGESRRGL